jgi:hypothetical protein
MRERGGATSDDATLFLLEWRDEDADHLRLLTGARFVHLGQLTQPQRPSPLSQVQQHCGVGP